MKKGAFHEVESDNVCRTYHSRHIGSPEIVIRISETHNHFAVPLNGESCQKIHIQHKWVISTWSDMREEEKEKER